MKKSESWKNRIDNIFTNLDECQIRAFANYYILKDKIYKTVLPKVIKEIQSNKIKVTNEQKPEIWGKLVAFGIFIMTHSILSLYKERRDDADRFNDFVILCFLDDFKETPETLIDFERDNPAMGESQYLWSLGSQICKVLGEAGPILAMRIIISNSIEITEIVAETTTNILKLPLDQIKAQLLNLSFVKDAFD